MKEDRRILRAHQQVAVQYENRISGLQTVANHQELTNPREYVCTKPIREHREQNKNDQPAKPQACSGARMGHEQPRVLELQVYCLAGIF